MAQLPAVLARQGLQIVSNLTPGGWISNQARVDRKRKKLINKGKKAKGGSEEE
jgi:hypothetical protein